MFPEYRELISRLKNTDRRFERLFEKHNELDHKVANMQAGNAVSTSASIEELKKEKLKLKDEIYLLLKKAESEGAQ